MERQCGIWPLTAITCIKNALNTLHGIILSTTIEKEQSSLLTMKEQIDIPQCNCISLTSDKQKLHALVQLFI